MAVLLTADHIAAAIGLPFASTTDEQWADLVAAGASDYVNGLPIADKPEKANQVLAAATMVAVDAYNRRPAGTVAPEFGDYSTVSYNWRLADEWLERNRYEKPWVV